MSVTLNGLLVTSLVLSLPRTGAWIADVVVGTTSPQLNAQDPVVPTVGLPGVVVIDAFTFNGSVVVSQLQLNGRAFVRVVGGKTGGMVKALKATNFAGASVQLIASSLLVSQGEVLNQTLSNANVLQSRLAAWQTFSDRTLAEELTVLVKNTGAAWRVDPATGTTFLTIDTFAPAATTPTNAVIEQPDEAGNLGLVCPALDKLPLPGTTVQGVTLNEVVIYVDGHSTRIVLRPKSLQSLVQTNRDQELLALYPCSVTADNGNNSFNVNPDSTVIKGVAGLQAVKLRGGASSTWTLKPGARVLLGFDQGDPSKPYLVSVAGWDAGDYLTNVAYGDPNAAQFVALANLVNANNQALISWIKSLTWAVATTGTATAQTGTATTPTPVTPSPPLKDVSCRRVKSD